MADDIGFVPLAKSGGSDDLGFTPIKQSGSFQKLKPTEQPRDEIVGNEPSGSVQEFPLWQRPFVAVNELFRQTSPNILRSLRDALEVTNPMRPAVVQRPAPRFVISLGSPEERLPVSSLQMVNQPDTIQPGRSLIDFQPTQFDANGRAVYNPFQKMVMGAVTPENLVLAGLAGGGGVLARGSGPVAEAANVGSRALSGLFAEQGAEALAPIVNPNATSEQRREAIDMAPLSALMLHGGAYGMLHEAPIPVQPTVDVGATVHPVEGNRMGSVAQVLQRIAQNPNSPYAKQAGEVLQSPRGQGVELLNKDVNVNPDLEQAGQYRERGQEINVHPEYTDNDFVVMHEISHFLTEKRLKDPVLNARLSELYNEAKQAGVDPGLHGMKNLDEFTTEAMTNPSFQQSLRFVRSGERSLFNKFLDFVNEGVGRARKKGSLLEQVEQATKPVVESPNEPLQLSAPPQEVPVSRQLPRFAQSSVEGKTLPSSGETIQLPQMMSRPRFVTDPSGRVVDTSQLTDKEQTELMRGPREYQEPRKGVRPAQEPGKVIGGDDEIGFKPLITGGERSPKTVESELTRPTSKEVQGGQVSFSASAESKGIPNARQSAQEAPEASDTTGVRKFRKGLETAEEKALKGKTLYSGIPEDKIEERIARAAVKAKNGDMYVGYIHADAAEKALNKGHQYEDLQNGFVTNKGRFLSRKQTQQEFGYKNTDDMVNKHNYEPEPLTEHEEAGNEPWSPAQMSEDYQPKTLNSGVSPLKQREYDRYVEVQRRMKELMKTPEGLHSPELSSLFKEFEDIRNRNGGMPLKNPSEGKTLESGVKRQDESYLDEFTRAHTLSASLVRIKDYLKDNPELDAKLGDDNVSLNSLINLHDKDSHLKEIVNDHPELKEDLGVYRHLYGKGLDEQAGEFLKNKLVEHGVDAHTAEDYVNDWDLGRSEVNKIDPDLRKFADEWVFPDQEKESLDSGISVKDKAKEAWKEFTTNLNNNERTSQLRDAVDTEANRIGEQKGNRLKVGLKDNTIDLNATTLITQAGFDRERLVEGLNKVKGKNPEAEQSYRRAIKDYSRLEPYARELKKEQEAQLAAENAVGIETPHLEDYMKHSFEDEDTGLFAMGPGGSFISTSFLKPKTYPDYATAIADGAKPKTLRADKLLQSRVAAGQKLIGMYNWANQLRELKAPNGDSLVADLIKRPGTKGYTAPNGYQVRDLSPGVRVAVSDSAVSIIDQLTKSSALRDWAPTRGLLKGEAWLKHKMLAFDSFHLFRVQRRGATLGAYGYEKGLSALKYDDATLDRLVKDKQISPEVAKWAKDNRGTVNLLTSNGLNAGRIAEALFAEVARRKYDKAGLNPFKQYDKITGDFNRWVFEDVSRGAMTIAAVKEFKRIKAERPEMTDQQAASYVAKQVNIAFGNLQRQGVLKSETFRDMASLVFFAPQWIESLAQGEGRAYKQMGEAVVKGVQGKKQIGTSAKMVGTSIAAWFLANQVINMIPKSMGGQGQPTWENEEGHKLDAKLPGGFWNSPFADTTEYFHDYEKYRRKGSTPLEAGGKIVMNKLSPVNRAATIMVSGRDYSGAKLGDSDRIKESFKNLLPTPLPLSGLTSEIPNQKGRQLYSTLGLKVEPDMRQHEEALEKIAGKPFEEMTFPERIEAERKRAESQPLQNADQAMKAAQKSVELVNQRGKQLQNGMSKEDRNWLTARGLSLGGYDSQINFTKQDLGSDKSVKVRLTDKEMQQYHDVLQKYYVTGMRLLREDYDKLDTVAEKKEYFTELMKYVRDGARQEMKKKMLDSNIEMNQKRRDK